MYSDEFLILTAARPGERMKSGEQHRVPLRLMSRAWMKGTRTMRKSKAVRMKPGTLIVFDDWRYHRSFGERLGRVERVTANGGVSVTPVVECFGQDTTVKPIGETEWLPYSKVQFAYPPSRRTR